MKGTKVCSLLAGTPLSNGLNFTHARPSFYKVLTPNSFATDLGIKTRFMIMERRFLLGFEFFRPVRNIGVFSLGQATKKQQSASWPTQNEGEFLGINLS